MKSAKKARLHGKWKVIKGKHMTTTVEARKAVEECQNAIKKRKMTRGTKTKKNKSKAREYESNLGRRQTTKLRFYTVLR